MFLSANEIVWGFVLVTAIVCTFGSAFVFALRANHRKVVDAQREKLAEAARREQTLREIPRHVLDAQEAERKRFAVDLHDGVQQVLAGTKMKLESVRLSSASGNPTLNGDLKAAAENLDSALIDIQRIIKRLRPKILDDFGLVPALESLCRDAEAQSGLHFRFEHGEMPRLRPDLAEAAYRIVQEGVHNIEKHARAANVCIDVRILDAIFIIDILDDGQGIESCTGIRKDQSVGIGLSSMRERTTVFGGSFLIEGSSGKGTKVHIEIPVVLR